jgi:large conductance mechanosensitive channel
MMREFREFIMRGNVLDLAVGVIIGAAFGAIVTSLVNDILMPPIGLALGGVDFKDLFVNLGDKPYMSLAELEAAGAPAIKYGRFMNLVIQFLIIAFVIFQIVKVANRLRRPTAAADPMLRPCPYCLMEIPLKATRCGHCTAATV